MIGKYQAMLPTLLGNKLNKNGGVYSRFYYEFPNKIGGWFKRWFLSCRCSLDEKFCLDSGDEGSKHSQEPNLFFFNSH